MTFALAKFAGHKAIIDGVGITEITTQEIWKDHPEKVLGTAAEFAANHPNTCRALIDVVRDAGKWIDASLCQQEQDGRCHRRQALRQHQQGCDRSTHHGALSEWP